MDIILYPTTLVVVENLDISS